MKHESSSMSRRDLLGLAAAAIAAPLLPVAAARPIPPPARVPPPWRFDSPGWWRATFVYDPVYLNPVPPCAAPIAAWGRGRGEQG